MNMMEANQLSNIYNTLLLVHTSGADTRIMSKCLEAFEALLTNAEIIMDTNNNGANGQEG